MGKLVRDRITDIIGEHGGDPVVMTVLGDADYRRALLEKLFEESTELSEASAIEAAEEINRWGLQETGAIHLARQGRMKADSSKPWPMSSRTIQAGGAHDEQR
ncbi:hypothetical protein SAMN05216276_1001300 [Streptosporangium subroseum]|uniref:Uncharacterized protein n=1 Tax=Streptosporangium subroseum TaxID=106412 RepID=A0A239AEK8_9ACTN|nr:hypothetical protein [Streptosporangium subroseum]SNR93343.1 hypothetical protein SAMN05216276_1001300 [Streptosporangium subroseum]